jgi:hypothetical protein
MSFFVKVIFRGQDDFVNTAFSKQCLGIYHRRLPRKKVSPDPCTNIVKTMKLPSLKMTQYDTSCPDNMEMIL